VTGPLLNRAALVTGASQGLGLAVARAFVEAGADIFLCARDAGKLDEARGELASTGGQGRRIIAFAADVSVEREAVSVASAALEHFPQLQILVNNAGIYGPIGHFEETGWRDWIKAVEVNLLGSALMCRALIPHFRKQSYGKIIQISGGGATNPLPNLSAYAASKAAVVRFAETLAEELRDAHVDINSVAPGALNTRLLDEVLQAGPARAGQKFYERSVRQKADGGTPPEVGAALCTFLASAASDGITGKLISAVWDPWSELPDRRADLDQTDVYTLRRIVPKDRGKNWGDK
jgi:NAD(P)-dependent dehydrogenase (short-subunit alcohol dehydrogenase family)